MNCPLLYWWDLLDKQTYIGKYTFMSVFCLLNKEINERSCIPSVLKVFFALLLQY